MCVGGKMLSCRILVGKCVLQKLNWINLAHDRDQWLAPCKYNNKTQGSLKCGEFLD